MGSSQVGVPEAAATMNIAAVFIPGTPETNTMWSASQKPDRQWDINHAMSRELTQISYHAKFA